jgi:Pvc16 N-terminal domain
MYTAIAGASLTLAQYIRQSLEADFNLKNFFNPANGGTMVVSLSTPEEMTNNGQEGLSVWLYRIARDDDRLNDPPQRLASGQTRKTPLPLRLHYLMAPTVASNNAHAAETAQTILGKVLQILYDHATLSGADLLGDLSGTNTQLTARLETMTLDEISKVWYALERSYELSVSYELTVVYIDSQLVELVSPVKVVLTEPAVIVSSS